MQKKRSTPDKGEKQHQCCCSGKKSLTLTSDSNCPSLVAEVVGEDRVEDGCVGRRVDVDGSSGGLVVAIEGDIVKDDCAVLQDNGGLTKRSQVCEGAVHNGQVLVGDGDCTLRQVIAPAIVEACSTDVE